MSGAGRARAAGAALLVLALAQGCSAVGAPAAPRTPAPVQASWPGCEAVGAFFDDRGQGPAAVGGVPAGFAPSKVVLCEEGERTTRTGRTVHGELERTSTDVGPLLTYLAHPDERPTNGACPAIAVLPPWLFLVDGTGRYVAPAIPVDACNLPIGWDDQSSAWEALTYSDRIAREVPAGENAQARKAGCPTTQKDVLDEYATSSRRRPGAWTSDPFEGRPLRYCYYQVSLPGRGSAGAPGVFLSGYTLVEEERRSLVTALLAAPAVPGPCAAPSDRFVVVGPRDGSLDLFVELAGCRRAVTDADSSPVVRAGDDLVALLGG